MAWDNEHGYAATLLTCRHSILGTYFSYSITIKTNEFTQTSPAEWTLKYIKPEVDLQELLALSKSALDLEKKFLR